MKIDSVQKTSELGIISEPEKIREVVDMLKAEAKEYIVPSELSLVEEDLENQYLKYTVYSRSILLGYAVAFNTMRKAKEGKIKEVINDINFNTFDGDLYLCTDENARCYYLHPIMFSKYLGELKEPLFDRFLHSIGVEHETFYEKFKNAVNTAIEKYSSLGELEIDKSKANENPGTSEKK